MSYQGRCLCGAVTYEFDGGPVSIGLCHCRDCQRASGTLFQHAVVVRRSSLRVEGEVSSFVSEGDNSSIARKFCPKCGSGLFMEPDAAPKVVIVKGGTLDNPEAFKPQREVYTSFKPEWLHSVDGIPGAERAWGYQRDS